MTSSLTALSTVALLACTAAQPQPEPELPSLGGDPRALAMHDVSILFPLGDRLWPATDLVPSSVFRAIGRSVVKELADADEYDALRVVAVRVDPCFRHDWGGVPCQPQLRLVLQAIAPDGTRAFDGALHALYNLDEATFATLATELRALTAAAPEQADPALALGVSPALRAQGVDGVYGQHLRALVRRYAREETLARLTFMTRTEARAGQWQFGGRAVRPFPETGFDPAGPLDIRALTAGSPTPVVLQTVTSESGPSGYHYAIDPSFADGIGAPAANAAEVAALPADRRGETYAWTLRQTNPNNTTPDSTDCASCHLAERARDHLEARFPELVDPGDAAERPAFTAGALSNPDNLRAFGYFDATPVVVLRTARESKLTLELFALLYP
jgi:hypothetical protein